MEKNQWKYLFLLVLIISTAVSAKVYDKTSFYVAYNDKDRGEYVLVMPMVKKVYAHKAGHIKPEDLMRIDTQFKHFPTYKDGKLCFSGLKSGASGNSGAKTMAGECYPVHFFYTQKERVSEGMTFILTYINEEEALKVYEGIAGNSSSFHVVKESSRGDGKR